MKPNICLYGRAPWGGYLYWQRSKYARLLGIHIAADLLWSERHHHISQFNPVPNASCLRLWTSRLIPWNSTPRIVGHPKLRCQPIFQLFRSRNVRHASGNAEFNVFTRSPPPPGESLGPPARGTIIVGCATPPTWIIPVRRSPA